MASPRFSSSCLLSEQVSELKSYIQVCEKLCPPSTGMPTCFSAATIASVLSIYNTYLHAMPPLTSVLIMLCLIPATALHAGCC